MASSIGTHLATYAAAIGARDWAALRHVLCDEATVTLLHTGETFDADGFVAFNRDYPGPWEFTADDVVDGNDRGALRAHTTVGDDVFHVATFASRDPASGLLTDLVEVWTEAVAPHPTRTPSGSTR